MPVSYIYILKHPTNQLVCKIGESAVGANTRTQYQDIKWRVHREFPVDEQHRRSLERYIHDALSSSNANIGGGAREIFTIPAAQAADKVERLIRKFMTTASAAKKDEDYWRYVASDDEKRTHEKNQQIQQERQQKIDEAKEYYQRRLEQKKDLEDYIKRQVEEGWFDWGILTLALLFWPVVAIAGGIAILILEIPTEPLFSGGSGALLSYLAATVWATWRARKDHTTRIEEASCDLKKLESENLAKCPSCSMTVRLPMNITGAEICPKCKCRLNVGS